MDLLDIPELQAIDDMSDDDDDEDEEDDDEIEKMGMLQFLTKIYL